VTVELTAKVTTLESFRWFTADIGAK